jgi:hypothetical protein
MNVLRKLFLGTTAIAVVTASAGAQATPRTKGVNLGFALNGSAIMLDDEDYGKSDT